MDSSTYQTRGSIYIIQRILSLNLLNREGKVSIREWLFFQRKMPPFGIERLEPMTEHCLTQNHAVGELLSRNGATYGRFVIIACVFARFRIAAEIRVTLRSKPVECTTHINLFFCFHIKKRQIDS